MRHVGLLIESANNWEECVRLTKRGCLTPHVCKRVVLNWYWNEQKLKIITKRWIKGCTV